MLIVIMKYDTNMKAFQIHNERQCNSKVRLLVALTYGRIGFTNFSLFLCLASIHIDRLMKAMTEK